MIEDFKSYIEKAIKEKNITGFSEEAIKISDKYGVCVKTVHNRFHSVYGKSAREYITERIFPTKIELENIILNSKNSDEVRKKLGLSQRLFSGIYDKYFGVSNYKKSRIDILSRVYTTTYNPQREDNRALIYSQILGDGSYDKKRHSLRVSHGIKQAQYLRWKVSLIKKGFPKVYTKITEARHTQGHEYASWYSGNLGNLDLDKTESEYVRLLTPLGWLLWFFDDGCGDGQNFSISIHNQDTRIAAIEELKTYGINSRNASPESVQMCGQEQDLLFYKNFIEPFINEIPECMKYKYEDIVGRL